MSTEWAAVHFTWRRVQAGEGVQPEGWSRLPTLPVHRIHYNDNWVYITRYSNNRVYIAHYSDNRVYITHYNDNRVYITL